MAKGIRANPIPASSCSPGSISICRRNERLVMRRQNGLAGWLWMAFLPACALADDGSAAAPDWSAVDGYIESRREFGRIPGVAIAVVRGDQIVYMRGYGTADPQGRAVTPQTPFVLGSLTKAFTALAVMQLVEQGEIELDQPARRYIPWFRVADERASEAITVRQLLNQTSGLTRYAGRRLLTDADDGDEALERHVRALADVRLSRPPGAGYEYSNANYTTAGLIVQIVSGQTYENYIRQKVFMPLEMRRSFVSQTEAEQGGLACGYRIWFGRPVPAPHLPFIRGELPAAYLCASAEDMGHWLIVHLNEGRFGETALLSPGGMATLHEPPARGWYAMGWSQSRLGNVHTLVHLGEVPNFRAQAVLAPGENLGVVSLINVDTQLDESRIAGLAEGVMAILVGQAPSQPADPGRATAAYVALGLIAAGQATLFWWSLRALGRRSRTTAPIRRSPWGHLGYVAAPLTIDLA